MSGEQTAGWPPPSGPTDQDRVLTEMQDPVHAQRTGHLQQSPEIPSGTSHLCHLQCQCYLKMGITGIFSNQQ